MKWLVPETQKLVHFLQNQLEGAPSGKMLRRVLEANLCRVNGVVERFGSAEVMKGAVVELSPAWQSVVAQNLSKFDTLHEDDHLLIVDKPAGWICTDDECLRAFGAKRYLIHRLDKDTTGALLIAKSTEMREAMIRLFRERQVEKLYYAIVDGVPTEERGFRKTCFAKVGFFEGQTCWGSRSRGLEAETHWRVLSKGEDASLIACQPLTGRTHQIRVHLAEIGHPILVDRQYAKTYRSRFFAKRPLLHAAKIRFTHPILGIKVEVTAPIPQDFGDSIESLGFSNVLEVCSVE
jgi:RluA family pseudouridine synthase